VYKQFLHKYDLSIRNYIRPVIFQAFQSPDIGLTEHYESLETLGDGVLKFLTVFFLVAIS
jgi:dsRNA-specific ribonuclease